MSNSKISALTSATTPLVGTETLPIVQGGATVKTTVADITNGGGYAGSFTTLSATGVTTVQAGTALLPAITTSGDTNTGIWFPAADTIAFTEGGAESVRINSSGNVGIGTSSPGTRLDVFQTNAKSATGVWQVQTFDSTSQTTGVGGGISFSGYKTATSSQEVFGAIDGYKENSTAGNAAGSLRFHTQVAAGTGLVERMRITSLGNVGIGNTPSGTYKLEVTGTASFSSTAVDSRVVITSAGVANTVIGFNNSGATNFVGAVNNTSYIGNGQPYPFVFGINGAERMRISSAGGVSINTTTEAGVGNLLMGTGNVTQGTAARGFNFTANTPVAGMTSQLLNWYEEGTFTPNQGAGLTLVGAFSSTGRYTRIGRQVSISGTVTGATSVAVTAAGVITSNLPFTVVTAGHGGATNVANNASATVICTGTSVTSAAAIAATATITFSATYFV